jgi:type 1 glutamine amidotransferase
MPLPRRALLALPLCLIALPAVAADPAAPAPGAEKRVLLVTHSGGFIHDSVGFAEETLKAIGPKHGLTVTCWRLTNTEDPSGMVSNGGKRNAEQARENYSVEFRKRTGVSVEAANCGRINKDTLKNFDCVLFFTTGNPCNKDELVDLMDWVKAGGAFAGTHCATDTLYNTPYGDLIGGYFDGHPWHQKIKLKLDDAKHPAAKGFDAGAEIADEIYQFRNWSRDNLHVLMSVDNASIDTKKGKRADSDYAVSWVKDYGKGKVFYTSLGHRKEVWKDERFQTHLVAGLKWAMGEKVASAAGN